FLNWTQYTFFAAATSIICQKYASRATKRNQGGFMKKSGYFGVLLVFTLFGCGEKAEAGKGAGAAASAAEPGTAADRATDDAVGGGGGGKGFSLPRPYVNKTPAFKTAIFAGGCFWCMEPPFEKLAGVKAVISGYSGGRERNPTYGDVSYGKT